MMDDEEDCEELPPITVNSSGRDSSWFAMPSAVELAAQRAREEHCERELVRLREEHVGPGVGPVAGVAHSDSSGSEGEAALAAAVTALRMRTAARTESPPRLTDLLRAAAPHLPMSARPFLLEYARTTADRAAPVADNIAREALSRMESSVFAASDAQAEDENEEATTAACGAWLCLALAAAERRALGPAAARVALCLLNGAPLIATTLAPALLAAVTAPRARIDLADALRGGDERSDALAAELVRASLADLLQIPEPTDGQWAVDWEGGAVARWRRLDAGAQYTALQLAARAHAWSGPGAGMGRLLDALTAAPPRDHAPAALKVSVAASKVRLLFPAKK